MNTWLTLREWLQFAGTLALELVIIFVTAKLVTRRLHSASWRRAVWQITVVAILLAAVGEMNGVRGWLSKPEQSLQTAPQRKVIVTMKDAELDPALFSESDFTAAAPANAGVEPSLSPWRQHVLWPGLVWIIVSAVFLARLLFAQFLALAIRLFGRRITDETTRVKTLQLADALGIRSRYVLRSSTRVVAPFTFGVWRPLIVLPNNFTNSFTSEQQDVALAHELAHIAGLDSAWRAFSQFVCALLWWHPLVWLAKRELDHASELVADESCLLVSDGPDRLASVRAVRHSWLLIRSGADCPPHRSGVG